MVSQSRTIEVRFLRAFVQVARVASVTAAAETMGVAKSMLSKQLATLEAVLQVRLFERSARRILLTPEGQMFLPRAESILADIDRLVVDAQEENQLLCGTVRIAASPEFGAFLSERFFPILLARYPALNVVLSLDYDYGDLHDPATDLAFRLGALGDDRLIARPLGSFSRIVVCSPDYARTRLLKQPEDLSTANALLFSDRDLSANWEFCQASDPAVKKDVTVTGRFCVRGFNALAAAAEAGLGIASVPEFLAASRLASGQLVRVLARWQSPPVAVNVAYRAGVSRIRRVRAVIDTAMEEVPKLLRPAIVAPVGPE